MSPRPTDFKVVADHLAYLDRALRDLRRLPTESIEAFAADWKNFPAAESLLRRSIETLVDVARHLLSRRHGLGALEYRQTARACAEHGLVRDEKTAAAFVEIAGFRNRITHVYAEVSAEELYRIVKDHLGDLEAVARELRAAAEEDDE